MRKIGEHIYDEMKFLWPGNEYFLSPMPMKLILKKVKEEKKREERKKLIGTSFKSRQT